MDNHDYLNSASNFEKSLKIRIKINDPNVATLYNNIGSNYMYLG